MMHRVSDGTTSGNRQQLNERTLRAASTDALHGLLQTELLLLEQEGGPGGNWRRRVDRIRWCQQLASELRGRERQLRLG